MVCICTLHFQTGKLTTYDSFFKCGVYVHNTHTGKLTTYDRILKYGVYLCNTLSHW